MNLTRSPASANDTGTREAAKPFRILTVGLACVLQAACTVGPDYREPPPVDTGDGWSLPVVTGSGMEDYAKWWSTLGDPTLDYLVDAALAENLDLYMAAARIEEARAVRDGVAGARAPVVEANASVNRRRQSANGSLPIASIPGMERTQTIHDVGFDAAWELDLFGGNRRALEGANARLHAAGIEAEGVRMRIVAEVARTWFTAVGAGDEVRALEAAVEAQRHSLQLVQLRHAAGDASLAEVDAVQARVAAAEASLPDIRARERAAGLALAVLLGEPPERGLALLKDAAGLPVLTGIPVGERADVLRRRPDVLVAERQLAAATADIGVAMAELFPKLSISVGGGFQALDAGDLFNSDSGRFGILPLISWRVFDGGRVRAEIRAREAAQWKAALAYEQAVLAALADAEKAMGDYRFGLISLERHQASLEASQRSYDHAARRYAAGTITMVELLAAQRQLHEAQAAVTRAHTSAAVQLGALYKALGGGWDVS
ncbi:efflux transporter outer membrane subunit [Aerolutibacter ruishenii]|uniref:NodT family efflux transporter outer membrane factor (OMF) lipoprotein n=1 Tax=Aerolutibacter ruishenii TaxID=686800 RepID=A0A562LYS2_9GAMM|nr:efflux transporter outer membrane subunit [Lysobacter ruishenii]TWI12776.1 NodT family efflux transporter outer membrane factor (OMF) lipoprotein [Lysobacter ruishenii]